ncbi:uncharacterized protein [Elaeis guineensis]|uniref:uncharacterized protein n=1 Tax=Elaeis guineensis var. tenera TaxID=51953 RepID=UPI003C6CE480
MSRVIVEKLCRTPGVPSKRYTRSMIFYHALSTSTVAGGPQTRVSAQSRPSDPAEADGGEWTSTFPGKRDILRRFRQSRLLCYLRNFQLPRFVHTPGFHFENRPNLCESKKEQDSEGGFEFQLYIWKEGSDFSIRYFEQLETLILGIL